MTIGIGAARLAAIHQDQLLLRHALQAGGHAVLRERDVLLVLSELVLSGAAIDPSFQAIANAVVAKASIQWQLPLKVRGAKPGGGIEYDPLVLTEQYFDLLDSGMTKKDCSYEIERKYGLSEKQVGRIVADNSWLCGNSKAARDQRRDDPFYVGMGEIEADDESIALSTFDRDTAVKKLDTIIGGA